MQIILCLKGSCVSLFENFGRMSCTEKVYLRKSTAKSNKNQCSASSSCLASLSFLYFQSQPQGASSSSGGKPLYFVISNKKGVLVVIGGCGVGNWEGNQPNFGWGGSGFWTPRGGEQVPPF